LLRYLTKLHMFLTSLNILPLVFEKLIISESHSSLLNVSSLVHSHTGVSLFLLLHSLLVQRLDTFFKLLDVFFTEWVATEGKAELIRRHFQGVLKGRDCEFIKLVQAQVEVAELRVLLKEPGGDFITFTILRHLGFKVINNGYSHIRLFTFSLLISLYDGIAFFNLGLVCGNLISSEGEAAKVFEHGSNVCGG
jgi:hypothetical protein